MNRNPLLSPGMARLLRWMVEDDPDGDIVGEKGTWYCGYHGTTWSTVKKLLVYCLITPDGEERPDKGFERYVLNSEGRAILEDPEYIPLIMKAIKLK